HNNLGILLAGLRKWAAAEAEYRQALEIQQEQTTDAPGIPVYQINLGMTYCNLGNLLQESGKPGDSLVWFGRAVESLTPLSEAQPQWVTAVRTLRNAHVGRALALDRLSRPAEALIDWDRAVALSPPADQTRFRAARAISRVQAGRVAEA